MNRQRNYDILKGNRICHPKIWHFGIWIIFNWRQSRCSRLRKHFYLSLTYLKEFRGPIPEKELLPEIAFFNLKDLLITKYLLFLSFSEALSSPLKPQTPISFLNSGWHISLNCPVCPWVPYLWVFCAYKINFSLVNLIYVNLIIRRAKDKKESFFFLHNIYIWACVFSHSVVSDSLWPIDSSPPGSSVHGIFQARILEWVAISSPGYSRHTMEYQP